VIDVRLLGGALAAGCLVVGVGCSSDSGYTGTVVTEIPPEHVIDAGPDRATPRWFLTLDLGGRRIAGTATVTIAFDPADASCTQDGQPNLDDFSEGAPVDFRRVGKDADTSSPPVISATDVTVEC
jgi:hypothetical protein